MNKPLHYYLIAEDDEDTRLFIQRAYDNLSLAVPMHFVSDGEQVIDYLEGRGPYSDRKAYPLPALIISDFKMPRKNRLEVLQWIRGSPFKEIVVVIFSGSDLESDVHQAYRFGANSFIHKPSAFPDLQHVLSAIHHYWFGCNYIPHVGDGVVGGERTPFKVVAGRKTATE